MADQRMEGGCPGRRTTSSGPARLATAVQVNLPLPTCQLRSSPVSSRMTMRWGGEPSKLRTSRCPVGGATTDPAVLDGALVGRSADREPGAEVDRAVGAGARGVEPAVEETLADRDGRPGSPGAGAAAGWWSRTRVSSPSVATPTALPLGDGQGGVEHGTGSG